MKKRVFNVLIILTSMIVLLVIGVSTEGWDGLVHQLTSLNFGWITVAFICMFMYWIIETFILHFITTFLHARQKLSESLRVTMIGQFFNSVTPFASGGQPAQLYSLMRGGIEGGLAGSIIMIKFIIFQGILTVYCLIVMIFQASFFSATLSSLFTLAILGFIVHTSVILAAALFAYNQTVTRKIFLFFFSILKRFRVIKNVESAESKLESALESFHQNATVLKNNLSLLVKSTILTIFQLGFYFMIPYFIYLAFGLDSASIWNMMAAQIFVTMMISFIPTPGATGGAEGGFVIFFNIFFQGSSLVSAILIWRIITYYSCIGFGGLFVILDPRKLLKSKFGV